MVRSIVLFLGVAALGALLAGTASAQTNVNLSLDIFYTNTVGDGLVDSTANGSWQLLATADALSEGLSGLDVSISGLLGAAGAEFRANDGLTITNAFKTIFDVGGNNTPWNVDQDGNASTLDMLFGQVPVQSPGPQELEYGVGTPGNIANTDELGVVVDTSGNTMTDAVLLAFGTFSSTSGLTINTSGNLSGANVFTVQGDSTNPPADDTILAASPFNVQTRSNLGTYVGDFNLDGSTDNGDVGILLGNFNGSSKLWQEGDLNGDKLVDNADVGQFLVGFADSAAAPDPGPVPNETACAEYDPATGNVKVSVNNVWNWFFTSTGNLTGDPAQGLSQQLTTDNDNTIGEGSFIQAFSYTDLDLGNVAATGLTANDFVFKYTIGGFSNGQEIEVPIKIIPEPTTLALAGLGLCGVLASRRRRTA